MSLNSEAKAKDQVSRFHARQALIMLMVFAILISALFIMLAKQYNLGQRHEKEILLRHFKEQVTHIDDLLARVTEHVDGMRTASEADLLQSRAIKLLNQPLEFKDLKDVADEKRYHLDTFTPPITRQMIGNLTGQGSIQERSRDSYREIHMALILNPLFRAVAGAIKNSAWVYYTSLNNFINIYPWVSSKDFKFSKELYTHEFYTLGLPENNPDRKRFWTKVYVDEYGKGLMTTCAAPIYDQDRFMGTVAIDLTVDFLNTVVKNFNPKQGVMFLVNDRDQLVAHPTLITSDDKRTKTINETLPEALRSSIDRLIRIPDTEITRMGSFNILRSHLHQAPWQVIYIENAHSFWNSLLELIGVGPVTILAMLLILVIAVFVVTHRQFILPSKMFVNYIMGRSQSIHTQTHYGIPCVWKPWFATVEKVFAENEKLTKELQEQNENLEQRVKQRTSELAKANEQLKQEIDERKHAEEGVKLNEQRLEALLELNQMAEATLEKIVAFAMEEAVRLTQSKIGYVSFVSEDESILTMYAWSRQALSECRIAKKPIIYPVVNTGLWGEAVRQRRAIITNNYQAPNPLKKGIPEGHVNMIRHMNVPIFDGNRIVIVAGVGNKKADYDDSDVRQLTLLMSGMWRIVQRKRIEETLRESEEKYRTVLEANPDPVVVYDMEGKVIYFNPAFTRIFGWTLEECLGEKMDVFVPQEKGHETHKIIERVLAGESFSGFETRCYTKPGNIIYVNMNAAIYKDQNNNPIGSVINLGDITERKKLEAQLQQAQKMQSIGTLAGGIAHDFNNILSALIGYTELAIDDAEKGTLQYENLQEVLIAGRRAKDLVQQILTFSRQSDQEQKPVNAQFIIKEDLKMLRASIPSTIEIKQNIQSEALVMGDSTQIHQVIINLCTNAAHAMEDKGGVLTVDLVDVKIDSKFIFDYPELKPGTYINLTVTDTGVGMAPDVLDKIFDPFFTTKGKGKGAGMGLSVVHGIVHSHGGSIHVYSEPGVGSTFKVFFPSIERRLKPEDRTEKPIPKGTERILFVDDELSIANMGKKVLESLGYDVVTRTSSIEALEFFRTQPDRVDIVITDLTMPNMTGEELAKELMLISPNIPIILCTGFSARMDERKAMGMGIRAFVLKPILKRQIAETIRKVIDSL